MKTKNVKQFITSKRMTLHAIVVLILFSLVNSNLLSAQTAKSDKFKETYELKELVILSRHNIRAPLSGKNSILGKITTHQWTNWTANASELTLKGGVLETMMGQYFRKWLEDEGLFKDGYCPNTDEVNIYSNSMQR
ncbi:MAG: glucose-1-phosphatase, partial [Mediterranea sp.]|nr:glucose-1-phosphatase [Mediterranea sp.]